MVVPAVVPMGSQRLILVRIQSGALPQKCPMRDQGAVTARRRGSRRRSMRALPARSVAMLGCDQVADQLDELLLAATGRGLRTVVSSFRDIGGVFAVHDEERHALD